MARKQVNLASDEERSRLKPRSSAYSERIGKGTALLLYVGPHKRTWRARVPGWGDVSIGDEAEVSYKDAYAKVVATARGETTATRRTIGDAWRAYVARAEATKTPAAVRVIRGYGQHVETLTDRIIADTPLSVLNGWRDGLLDFEAKRPRGPKTVNKVIRSLKAALATEGIDGPWLKLRQLDEPDDEAQPHVLTPADMRRLLTKAYEVETDFARLYEGLWLTGCRPGELRAAKPEDYRPGVLTVRGKTGRRHITLISAVDRFFAAQVERRDPILFSTADGHPWGEHDLRRPLERVSKAMCDDAVDATPYTARHSFITAGIYAGVPPFVLAKHCGTSIAMIEKTYGHVIAAMQAQTLARMDSVLFPMFELAE